MNPQPAIGTSGALDRFRVDLAETWRCLPNKGFFVTLLLVWLALFHFLGNSILGYVHTPSLFGWTYESYMGNSDDAIGLWIPVLVAGLFWWKRKELLALRLEVWWPGLLILAAAIVLHVLGYLLQEPRISIVALFTGIYGLTGLAWGWGWLKKSIFPFFLFAFCIPLASHTEFITFPLRLLVSRLVELVSHGILGIDVIRVGTELRDPSGRYKYEVAAACSGIRSLYAIFLMATICGFVAFKSPWKRLLMIALSVPLAVLGNLVRMLCIIIAAQIGGQKAGNYVHEGGPGGILSLLPYVPAIIGVLLVMHYLKERKPEPQPTEPQPTEPQPNEG